MPDSTLDKHDSQLQGDIPTLRLAIDEIDAKILDLINQRLLLCQQKPLVDQIQNFRVNLIDGHTQC